MRQTISVKFFARRDRTTATGLVPIFMRIGLEKKRLNVTTKIHVNVDDWSIQDCQLKTKSNSAKSINKMLDGFKMKALDYQRELMNEGKPITLENIKASGTVSLWKEKSCYSKFSRNTTYK